MSSVDERMLDEAQKLLVWFQSDLKAQCHQVTIMAVASSIAYLVEFWGYPPIKYGRPTILLAMRIPTRLF